MLPFVNYEDQEIAAKNDNPTIGLLLCSEKNDAVVRYVLADKNRQVFASRYQFVLPSEAQLRAEIARELDLLGQHPPAPAGSAGRAPLQSDTGKLAAAAAPLTNRPGAARKRAVAIPRKPRG